MTTGVRRRVLPFALLAPLAAVPLLAWLLMEFGPERSFLFAGYLFVWAIAFLVAGVVVAKRRPTASGAAVLWRAAAWALVLLCAATLALLAASVAMTRR